VIGAGREPGPLMREGLNASVALSADRVIG
jgi:hypothetical protein